MWACRIYKQGDKRYLKWTSVNESQRNLTMDNSISILKFPVPEAKIVEIVSCIEPDVMLYSGGGHLFIPGRNREMDDNPCLFPEYPYTKQLIAAMRAAGIRVTGYNDFKITVNTRKSY